jgi:hypothetical protein
MDGWETCLGAEDEIVTSIRVVRILVLTYLQDYAVARYNNFCIGFAGLRAAEGGIRPRNGLYGNQANLCRIQKQASG